MENKRGLVTVIVFAVLLSETLAGHFRGGTISWEPLGGKQVKFTFKLGWTYGSGAGCTKAKIGKHVNGLSGYWVCTSGCPGRPNLHTVNYICMGADPIGNWEQGQDSFVYTLPNNGPITVGFSGGNWISLGGGKGGGSWNVATTVNLGKRSDTANINNSPVSLSRPMYHEKYNCDITFHVPIVDPDGDRIVCRWASGRECGSACNALPGAILDPKTCTLHFKTVNAKGYSKNGVYAVALTIEDYPRVPITMGGTKKTPSDPLSSVPLQFLIQTLPAGSCDDKPQFVPPTPTQGTVITVEERKTFTVDLYADNGNDTKVPVKSISPSGIIGMTGTPVTPVANKVNTFKTTLTWPTAHKDLGNHLLCASVRNANGISGTDRCITITVVPQGCGSNPCQNRAKCNSLNGNYSCTCRPGFTGQNCDVNIDDCAPVNPCLHGTCIDSINMYTCNCTAGYTGKTCQTNIDDCQPNPCQNGGKCIDGINQYTCNCAAGYTGIHCAKRDHCIPNPCKNGALCADQINKYFCVCPAGYTGKTCKTDINDCASNPCMHGAKCLDKTANFSCACTPGYTGRLCQTGHNFCKPNPCKRGGNCINGVASASCKCPNGWSGTSCNFVVQHPTKPPITTTIPITTVTTIVNQTTTVLPTCPPTDYECECVLGPPKIIGLSRTLRDVIAFFYGFPFGLVLSVATYYMFSYCVFHCQEDDKYYYPQSKSKSSSRANSPGDSSTAISPSPWDTDHLSLKKKF